MSLKAKVTELLNEADDYIIQDFFHSEISEETRTWDSDKVTDFRKLLADQNITFEHVDNYGGEEQGRDYWSVYRFSQGDDSVLVRFDGWYQSYNGSEFEEWFFVEAKPVQAFEYVRA